MSVIITTPDSYDTIRPLVGALHSQTARDSLELVIVAPSAAAIRGGIADLQDFRSWRIVELGVLRTVAQAKAAGIRCATAPVVVLTEDHCFPDPHWAHALIDAHRGEWAAIGPAMENANPQSLISWADFILGYGPWFSPPGAGEVDLLPGHNSSYKRDILLGTATASSRCSPQKRVSSRTSGRADIAFTSNPPPRHYTRISPNRRAGFLTFFIPDACLRRSAHAIGRGCAAPDIVPARV